MPISSQAHQVLLRYMFGVESRNFLQEFLVHIGLLIAIYVCCRDILVRLRRQKSIFTSSRHNKKRRTDAPEYFDLRLLKTACFPLVIGLVLFWITLRLENSLLTIILFLLINALILFLAAHSQHGNRDAKTMTGLDGVIIGILGSLSVFPGISRIGIVSTYTTLRGADLKNVVNWAVLLSIPAIILFVIFDILGIITIGFGTISLAIFINYIFSGIAAFCGGYIAISILLNALTHSGFSYFAYYSIGAALFTFILYLIT